jgi:flagellar hook-basal body complex protein FliE
MSMPIGAMGTPQGADRPLGIKQVSDLPIVGQQPESHAGPSFASLLESLGQTSNGADRAVEDLATAEERDLHDVMLAVEMESMSFELAVQIRNHLVDGWNEIFRMAV